MRVSVRARKSCHVMIMLQNTKNKKYRIENKVILIIKSEVSLRNRIQVRLNWNIVDDMRDDTKYCEDGVYVIIVIKKMLSPSEEIEDEK
jgi:hypothetical protein